MFLNFYDHKRANPFVARRAIIIDDLPLEEQEPTVPGGPVPPPRRFVNVMVFNSMVNDAGMEPTTRVENVLVLEGPVTKAEERPWEWPAKAFVCAGEPEVTPRPKASAQKPPATKPAATTQKSAADAKPTATAQKSAAA